MKITKNELNRLKLYTQAVSFLGIDASPLDEAPDDVGCADSVSRILKSIFPQSLKGSIATAELYKQLRASPDYKLVTEFRAGDIIISPTGMGKTGKIKHGHVGIIGEYEEIMSNSSATGLWTNNYTLTSWVDRYRTQGGYPIYFFRKI